jgi:UDP-glucose 4-epimerase
VVVAGGCGFLGSHLVRLLCEERGCDVLVIDNLVAGRREFLHPAAKFCHADITGSEEYLRSVIAGHGARFAFNYASFPYIPDSFARPLHVFTVNANGALKFIHAAAEAGCEAILQVSSAEIYGGGQWGDESLDTVADGRLRETASVAPHSSYGAAKAAIDFMVQARWREAKTPCIALRQFNCVGERETHPYIVPEIIGQLSRAREAAAHAWGVSPATGEDGPYRLQVRLGNDSFRDFLYAGDAVRMAVELLERGEFGGVYNLGSEEGIKMYALAEKIGRLMGFGEVEVVEDAARKRPWEIWHLLADCRKVYSVIESRPQVSLDEALRRTIAYYRANGNRWCWE